MGRYERRRLGTAFLLTRQFWTTHQFISFLITAALTLAIGAVGRRTGWYTASWIDIGAALFGLYCALIAAVLSFSISFLLNYLWAAPALIDAERQKTTGALQQRIEEQKAQLETKPTLPAHQSARLNHVRQLLVGATGEELKLLKYLANNGRTHYEEVYRVHSRPIAEGAYSKWKDELIIIREHCWMISEGAKDPLIQVLYEPREPNQ
jgi:hypothetical protein